MNSSQSPNHHVATDGIRALIAVDHVDERRAIERGLWEAGVSVSAPGDVVAAHVLFESFDPDIVIADTEMCDDDGAPFVSTVAGKPDCYLIGIDTTGSEQQRIALLRSGADDAMSRPVSPDELAARCDALMRRRPQPPLDDRPPPSHLIDLGPLVIDGERHELRFGGQHIPATRIEFALLEHLGRHQREVVSRRDLLEAVWGPHWAGDTHVVDVHLSNLRRKLDAVLPDLPAIHTVRGIGFRISNELLDAAIPPSAPLHLATVLDHVS